mmetsp:Transcript_73085/g.236575  ORF Transcript_73085/g.236575 Transcript_73085/m.236575 type:complete len:239 (-) Transcript_73085:8-724(-)
MLLTRQPLAFVLAVVAPAEDAMSFFDVVHIVANVNPAVGPLEPTLAVHAVREPLAPELPAVAPHVEAVAIDVIFLEGAVGPMEPALAALVASNVLALEPSSIGPRLDTQPVLLVGVPVSIVLRAVCMLVHALTVSLVLTPLAFVHVALAVVEAATALRLVAPPLTYVLGTVGPYLLPLPMPLRAHPLSGVLGPVGELLLRSSLRLTPFGNDLDRVALGFGATGVAHRAPRTIARPAGC